MYVRHFASFYFLFEIEEKNNPRRHLQWITITENESPIMCDMSSPIDGLNKPSIMVFCVQSIWKITH